MNLIAWSQNMTPEAAKAAGAILVSKDQLFERADILTIHLVLSTRTRGLVGAAELQRMKPTALTAKDFDLIFGRKMTRPIPDIDEQLPNDFGGAFTSMSLSA
jgi:hypothetical protein